MAKERSTDKDERRREKKEKKEKKEKRSEKDGVHKSKKQKKEKKLVVAAEEASITTALLNDVEKEKPGSVAVKEDGDVEVKVKSTPLLGALVPFANPLADDKVGKKVLKSVKKGKISFKRVRVAIAKSGLIAAKNKSLKRGVKEVVKSLRKSTTATASGGEAPGVVVLAADISPMDVISHIPVLCEDHGVPYIFVPSRAELGAAGSTKRPTSVVMVSLEKGGKKKAETDAVKEEGEDDFAEVYKELVRVVQKASRDVRI
ncbi:snoRNA-binding protein [Varicellaria rhodocarpa]|nr:snoRNA-binding protein [Varicellaria rhodocarpa]